MPNNSKQLEKTIGKSARSGRPSLFLYSHLGAPFISHDTMLKGISPLLTPELLKILAEMGHDDAILLADANFTAMSLGAGKPIVRLPGTDLMPALQAVISLMGLAADVPHPVAYMQVSGSAEGYQSALQREVGAYLAPHMLPTQSLEAIERYAFYERVKTCYALVVTGEQQPFGNFILRKGVVGQALRV